MKTCVNFFYKRKEMSLNKENGIFSYLADLFQDVLEIHDTSSTLSGISKIDDLFDIVYIEKGDLIVMTLDSSNLLFVDVRVTSHNSPTLTHQLSLEITEILEFRNFLNHKQTKACTIKAVRGPYIIFCDKYRPEIMSEHPDWTVTQISTELGRLWSGMSEDEKRPYIEASQKDRLRFQKEMNKQLNF